MKEEEYQDLSIEEEAYRRGYSQGFAMAREEHNKDLSIRDVLRWRHGEDKSLHPPGTSFYQKRNDENDR